DAQQTADRPHHGADEPGPRLGDVRLLDLRVYFAALEDADDVEDDFVGEEGGENLGQPFAVVRALQDGQVAQPDAGEDEHQRRREHDAEHLGNGGLGLGVPHGGGHRDGDVGDHRAGLVEVLVHAGRAFEAEHQGQGGDHDDAAADPQHAAEHARDQTDS